MTSAFGATIHVPDDYATIQAGIDAAEDGDTVLLVADGIYSGLGNKNVDFQGKAITVQSENGPDYCVIDCENDGRGFYFHNGESSDSVGDGFTIINGQVTGSFPEGCGGGIACFNSSPMITNCTIIDSWGHYGGGVYCNQSSAIIKNSTISNNGADDGAGIRWDSSLSITIENCIISGNSGRFGCGGGIFSAYGSHLIKNCIFSGNNAECGGAIYCAASFLPSQTALSAVTMLLNILAAGL